MDNFEYRVTTRNASCRCCDKDIPPKTEKIIYTYSIRNCGQNIFLCIDCVEKMFNKIKEEDWRGVYGNEC